MGGEISERNENAGCNVQGVVPIAKQTGKHVEINRFLHELKETVAAEKHYKYATLKR